MMDSAMDDGDLARLLRRTIDLLAQVYYHAYRFSIMMLPLYLLFLELLCYHYHLHYVINLAYVPDSKITRH